MFRATGAIGDDRATLADDLAEKILVWGDNSRLSDAFRSYRDAGVDELAVAAYALRDDEDCFVRTLEASQRAYEDV